MSLTAVDLFCGAGGTSQGAKMAGVKVLWAANHSPIAVEIHTKNHPDTVHSCQDLQQADWTETPRHDIMLASPACTGFTKARGKDRKHHDSCRSTAWAVIDCVEVKQPKYILVENVPEFANWKHYQRWRACLAEDYHLSENILDAADLGVPQHRVRLFVLGVHKKTSRYPISVTKPSIPHTPATSIIEWDCEKGWDKIDREDRSINTLIRIANGRRQFGKKPFLIAYYGNSKGGRSLDRPLGTVTTKDRYALIDGKWMRMLNPLEYKAAMGFPKNYILPSGRSDSVKMLGNAVVPLCASYLLRQIQKSVLTR